MKKVPLFAALLVMTSAAVLVEARSYSDYRKSDYTQHFTNYRQEVGCFRVCCDACVEY